MLLRDTGTRSNQTGDKSNTLQAVEELNEILTAETAALRERNFERIEDFTRRKSQALIQISNGLQAPARTELHPSLQDAFSALRARLVQNEEELQMHIRAAKEVSDTLTRLVLDAESDGTYSRDPRGLDF